MLHHAHIWFSIARLHVPLATLDCNCQSISTVTLLTAALCEVLLSCLSTLPSACVLQHLSDVGLINYMGRIPQEAHTHTHTHTHPCMYTQERGRQSKGEKETEEDRASHSLYSLPALILFIQWICFSFHNPPLISFHLSLWSQSYHFTKVTSEHFSFSLSHFAHKVSRVQAEVEVMPQRAI